MQAQQDVNGAATPLGKAGKERQIQSENEDKLEQITFLKINILMAETMASDVEYIHKQRHMNRPKNRIVFLRLLIYEQLFLFLSIPIAVTQKIKIYQ